MSDDEAPSKKRRMMTPEETVLSQVASLMEDRIFCACRRLDEDYTLYSAPEEEDVIYHLVISRPDSSLEHLKTCEMEDSDNYHLESMLEGYSTLEEALASPETVDLLHSYHYQLNKSEFEYDSLKAKESICTLQPGVVRIPRRNPKSSPGDEPTLYLTVLIPQENYDEAKLILADSLSDIHSYYLRDFSDLEEIRRSVRPEAGEDESQEGDDERTPDGEYTESHLADMYAAIASQHSDFSGAAADHSFLYENRFLTTFDVKSPNHLSSQ